MKERLQQLEQARAMQLHLQQQQEQERLRREEQERLRLEKEEAEALKKEMEQKRLQENERLQRQYQIHEGLRQPSTSGMKQNVCIGMICTDIVVEKQPLMLIRDYNFEIVTMESEGKLQTQNYSFRVISRSVPKKFYGWIPFKDTKVLGPLVDHRLIWWDTVIPRGKANGSRTPIYIILYCRPDMVATLSKYLMSQRVILKTPPFYNPECHLYNPHAFAPNQPYIEQDLQRQHQKDIQTLLESIPHHVPFLKPKKKKLIEQEGLIEISSDEEEEKAGMENGFIEGLRVRLMPHQIQGVSWMMDRENNKSSNGGILADKMGLGKTIQTIALVLSTLKSEAEEVSVGRSDDRPKVTLIVTPLSLLQQWVDEINNKTDKIRVLKHHGPSRERNPAVLEDYDVIVTTYQVLASDMASTKKQKKKIRIEKRADGLEDFMMDDSEDSSGSRTSSEIPKKWQKLKSGYGTLFQIKWHRVVLDEAQQIKNRTTKASLSCSELNAAKRWCLTGTPLQNNVDELYSLFRFLRIQPLAEYHHFKQNITLPISAGNSRLALERLKAVLMAVMLRRTKDVLGHQESIEQLFSKNSANLQLPTKERQDIMLSLSEPERRLYDTIVSKGKNSLQALLTQQQGGYASVLLLLLKLRQACDHPQLVLQKIDKDILELEPDIYGVTNCQLCGGSNMLPDSRLCKECIEADRTLPPVSLQSDGFQTSTKVTKLIEILKETRERYPHQKTIVFSQFTSMLDLIEKPLSQQGFHYCRYDGSMSSVVRERNLDKLKYDPGCTVMLISLKCGSLGLNLTAANRVILMDVWWNPALEEQAIDRVHRIGQKLPVYVTRLIVDHTVELKIMALQHEKAQLTKGAIGDGLAKATKLTANEIRKLFDL
ncbi:SNF2 family N-terminal domain-containing protein [Blakeslea trispora]|nr:SNF2 family N-terminal domain-containing protein [Blakeslea trispora]